MAASEWHGKKIVAEEKWSRIYEVEGGVHVNVSKFVTDEITISADAIKDEWKSYSRSERIAFAGAFSQKPHFSLEDEKILDFLMDNDDERVWVSIAHGLTRHSQKKRVLHFLLERLKSGSESKANYVYSLGPLGAAEAVPQLKGLHDRLLREIAQAGTKANKALILDFVVCCSSLAKLEGSSTYRDEIRPFLDHPDKHVQAFSRIYFEGGPPAHRS